MTENGNENGNGNGQLSGMQKAFVNEWFKDFNGTRAAERAGYSGDDNALAASASRLLRTVKVSAEIDKRWAIHGMSADEVVARLAAQARGDVSEFVGAGGVIDWPAVRENGHLIKRITHTAGKNSVIELHDAQSALVQIGRTMGLFVDRKQQEVDVTSGGERIASEPDLDALAAAIASLKPDGGSEGCGGCQS